MSKTKKEKSEKSTAEPDPDLSFGKGSFILPNGDLYEGDYCAHRIGIIWREGHGIYTSKDGQRYEGEWKDDKLVEGKEVIIKYPNGAEYYGPILKDKYCGPGTYILENKMRISCEFVENKPKGEVALIDVNGRVWAGQARKDDVVLQPENVFYNMLPESRGIGELKEEYKEHEKTAEELTEGEKQPELTDAEMEKLIFARSTKTRLDLNFDDSRWNKYFEHFKKKKIRIKSKIDECGFDCLTKAEKKWYDKYIGYKETQKTKLAAKEAEKLKEGCDNSLLEKYQSEEYQNSFPAMKVFHPSKDWKTDSADDLSEKKVTIEETEPNAT